MQDLHAKNITNEKCDELAFLLIQKEWRREELRLMRVKWFDYRFMHPTRATYLFAHEYEKAYKVAFAANFDRRGVRRVFKADDLFACDRVTISGVWRARQMADELAMPYDVYAREAITEVLRYWKQSSIPRPTQLYSERVIDKVSAKWEELQRGMLFSAKHEQYQISRFIGSRDQVAHHDWLFTQAGHRAHPVYLIQRFLKEGLLPRSVVADRCPNALDVSWAA